MKIAHLLTRLSPAFGAIYEGWQLPEYCMATHTIDKYSIEPLAVNRELELVQTQVIARHGARAPYYRVFCWETAESPVNAVWNCSTSSVWSEDIIKEKPGYGRLYKKQYIDGLNILSGTCAVGGLLPLGREQHRRIGKLLREAYIGDGPLKLFNTSNLNEIPRSAIYLRSDDEERTLGSGQALVDGLFPYIPADDADTEHMLTWMTADGATDYIDHKNDNSCPALGSIMDQVKISDAWVTNLNAPDVIKLQEEFERIVNGTFSWDTCLECLMIARCNNLPLPPGTTPEIFDGLINQVQTRKKILLTHEDAKYAKIDMHQMWSDVLERIDGALKHPQHTPKLFITIAHDSTLMPMLAVLLRDQWDGKWTTYAGNLVIELYKDRRHKSTTAPNYFVRFVYNGKPLQLPFCDEVLCDWQTLNASLAFARSQRPCSLSSASLAQSKRGLQLWRARYLHWLGAALIFCGCVVMTIIMVRELRRRQEDPASRYLLG